MALQTWRRRFVERSGGDLSANQCACFARWRKPRARLPTALVLALTLGPLPSAIGTAPVAAAETGEPAQADATPKAEVEPVYRIGAADELDIAVRGEPELSDTYLVRPDGRITFPLIGDLSVVGRTPAEVSELITGKLEEYIRTPHVSVAVETATGTFADRIRVTGGAVTPRSLPYRAGMTVLDVVLALGGLPDNAAGDSAYLLRRRPDGERERVPLRLETLTAAGQPANVRLRPGDVVVIPVGFFAGDWRFEQFLVTRQTFTDNVDLEPSDEKESALISEIGPGVRLDADLARVQAALNGSVVYRRESLSSSDNDIRVDARGVGTVEWLRDLFLTDFAASVSQQSLDSGRGTSASAASDANRETVQTYRVSPYLVRRLGRTASLEARYAGTVTLIGGGDGGDDRFGGDETSDSIEHAVTLQASSGPVFGRYGWSLIGRATELDFDETGENGDVTFDDNNNDLSRREVILRNQYALFRDFALIGDVGYQKLDSDDETDSFESPLWRAGFRWTPSEATELFATVGQQDDDEALTARARHAITSRTEVTLSYDQRVATGQERLAAALPQTPEDLEDFDPRTDRFSIRDEVTRIETLSARLDTTLGRNTMDFEARYQTEEEDIADDTNTEESLLFGIRYSRPLTRELNLSLDASFENTTFDEVRTGRGEVEDDDYDLALGFDYTGLRNIDLGLTYFFSRRESTESEDEFTENAVTFTGRLTF